MNLRKIRRKQKTNAIDYIRKTTIAIELAFPSIFKSREGLARNDSEERVQTKIYKYVNRINLVQAN